MSSKKNRKKARAAAAKPTPTPKEMRKRRILTIAIPSITIILIFVAFVSAIVGTKSITVADARGGSYVGQEVKITCVVVADSYSTDSAGTLTFQVKDKGAEDSESIKATYANGTGITLVGDETVIVTGTLDSDKVLTCTRIDQ